MHRRDLVRFFGAALALPFLPTPLGAEAAIRLGQELHLRAGQSPFRVLNADQQRLVTEIAEMLIPETDTPGATSVKVPEFIDLILGEWASDEEKTGFLAGLADVDAKAAALGAARFTELSPARKTELLTTLDTMRADAAGAGLAFARLKALTVYGYFTSRVVDEKILKSQMYFDRYRGDVPFTPAV